MGFMQEEFFFFHFLSRSSVFELTTITAASLQNNESWWLEQNTVMESNDHS